MTYHNMSNMSRVFMTINNNLFHLLFQVSQYHLRILLGKVRLIENRNNQNKLPQRKSAASLLFLFLVQKNE